MSTEAITMADSKRFIALETIIKEGKAKFIEVGKALAEIRDSRLYRGANCSESAQQRPQYPDDLNAMADVERTLTHDEWRIYLGFVMGERIIPNLASMEEFHRAWNATAAQRAEAYLRTKGLHQPKPKTLCVESNCNEPAAVVGKQQSV